MGAFTYPRSEPGSGGHQDLVERLNAAMPALRREVDSLSDAAVSFRPQEGEWSIKEVCGHLCDHARFFHQRLFAIIKLEEPFLPSWDQEEQRQKRDAQAATIAGLVAEFVAQRTETVELLADLVHWNWARQGRHEQHGRISVRQLVDRAIAHDETHIAQIHELREQALAQSQV